MEVGLHPRLSDLEFEDIPSSDLKCFMAQWQALVTLILTLELTCLRTNLDGLSQRERAGGKVQLLV